MVSHRDKDGNKFYLGENQRNWKADFDFFVNTNMPCVKFYEKSQEIEPEKKTGPTELEKGVDNETASRAISDILRGIK